MKALVFHHPGKVEVNDVDDPRIEDAEDVMICTFTMDSSHRRTTWSSGMSSWG